MHLCLELYNLCSRCIRIRFRLPPYGLSGGTVPRGRHPCCFLLCFSCRLLPIAEPIPMGSVPPPLGSFWVQQPLQGGGLGGGGLRPPRHFCQLLIICLTAWFL